MSVVGQGGNGGAGAKDGWDRTHFLSKQGIRFSSAHWFARPETVRGGKVGEVMLIRPSLLFQGSRPGLFYDVSTGESFPLRIPLDRLGAAVSPIDTP